SVIIGAGYGLTAARTASLVTLVMSQLIHVFECRSEKKSIFTIPVFGNMKLVGAVLISFAVLVLAVYFPPLQAVFSTVALGERELAVSLGFAAAAPLIRAFALMFTEK
ncbi:MAG: cation transporting ATPase C-terminal domain-containing protein, partial [Oscillospiraceae bacterium]|nr:cation transporting ATPase C-terminal domain-containing protein [Oscillospiraceae bacterium]